MKKPVFLINVLRKKDLGIAAFAWELSSTWSIHLTHNMGKKFLHTFRRLQNVG